MKYIFTLAICMFSVSGLAAKKDVNKCVENLTAKKANKVVIPNMKRDFSKPTVEEWDWISGKDPKETYTSNYIKALVTKLALAVYGLDFSDQKEVDRILNIDSGEIYYYNFSQYGVGFKEALQDYKTATFGMGYSYPAGALDRYTHKKNSPVKTKADFLAAAAFAQQLHDDLYHHFIAWDLRTKIGDGLQSQYNSYEKVIAGIEEQLGSNLQNMADLQWSAIFYRTWGNELNGGKDPELAAIDAEVEKMRKARK